MLDAIETRRSIRRYTDRPVEEEKLLGLLEAARLSPCGSHTEPWNFILIRSEEKRRQLMEIDGGQAWMMTAPVFIVCVADIRCRIPEGPLSIDENSPQFEVKQIIRDTTIATEHMVLEAEHQGLSTCWTVSFTQDQIRPLLNLPEDKFVCCVLTVGYGDYQPKDRPRRSVEDIAHWEHW